MILVTGAAGKTGRAVIRALTDRGREVRALVRRAAQEPLMLQLGVTQVVAGDLGDLFTIREAVAGAQAIYHICPNVDPFERKYAELLIGEAVSAGVEHFGYHSVLHPQTERMIHHWQKLRVEEALFESGLPFTILQPCAYMQNLLAQRDTIVENRKVTVPYSVKAKLSLVDLQDVAAAAATVMCEPGHQWATYELAGPEALDHVQIAAIMGVILGMPVQAEQIGVEAWADNARRSGMGEYQRGALRAMFEYYDNFGFCGNSNSLTRLLGRRPGLFEDAVKRMLAV